MNISKYIDYTLLEPTTTERDIVELCQKAEQNNFYSVCVNSAFVPLARKLLEKGDVKVCTVIGFPFGAMSTKSKVFEAEQAVIDGADEIDMVMGIGFLKSRNYNTVLQDISQVKSTIGTTPLKVILEISELNKNEIIRACEICLDAKVDFIKTSTGFSKSGATLTAVKIIKKTVRDGLKIKASGGIGDYETALKYIDAGADRIGTSSTIKSATNAHQARNARLFKKYIETAENSKLETKDVLKNQTANR
ncbi:deoxyribose-phosphate aldolase [uncultured Algibacter sp.]|uniref:deoxyribose-phosphate aldolase n=1 Tax=uncultured Algibacter sp. TaxID=298659 RepID=UPI003217DFAB